jgi:RHS repeat-associated protein
LESFWNSVGGWQYDYSPEKQLLGVTAYSAARGSFVYDGLGRCVKRTLLGVTTVINYDNWKPIMEWSSPTQWVAWNAYGPGADEIVWRQQAGVGYLHYHSDRHGNVTAVLDGSGNVLERYGYDAFGMPTVTDWWGNPHVDANNQPQSWDGNRFMFQGREYLNEIELYDFRHRFYDPGLGRFYQSDPTGFDAGDMNLFRYCDDDPVDRSDPTGLDYGPFDSADQAYRIFDAKFNNRSIHENKEYRSEIYQGTGTNKFYLTEGRVGSESRASGIPIEVKHSKYVGPAHTHGDWSTGYVDRDGVQHITGRAKERRLDSFRSQEPSGRDRDTAKRNTVYTSTPARDGWRQRPGEPNPERVPTRDRNDPQPSNYKPIDPHTIEQWEKKPDKLR